MILRALMAFGCLLALVLAAPVAAASEGMEGEDGCPDTGVISGGKFLNDLCWSCMLPIRVAGVGASGRGFPGDMASPMCVCPSKSLFGVPTPGMTAGMWKPTHFLESTRQPWCLAALGTRVNVGGIASLMQGDATSDRTQVGYRHQHLYAFPVGAVLDALTDSVCSEGSFDLDLLMLTEIDPTYRNGELSMVINPEGALFNNPVAIAACMADSVASSAYRPIRELFWCAGSWGLLYPLTGFASGDSSPTDMSLGGTRLLALQHKRMLMNKTYGNSAVCSAHPYPLLPKQQYRHQVIHPVPQRRSNDWTGSNSLLSREHRHIPVVGEDWVQILWRYEECCINIP
jgi:conjugal transfer pilus assembly protein TraU